MRLLVFGFMLCAVAALSSCKSSAPAAETETKRVSRCLDARKGLAFYRERQRHWRELRGAKEPRLGRKPRSCADARYLAGVARLRAAAERKITVRWQVRKRALERARILYERTNDPTTAICHVFGRYCDQALRVASCESGRATWAQNGQYLGMFQMGSWERATYGHGSTALAQAQAAYRYFSASGYDWSPWSCKPW